MRDSVPPAVREPYLSEFRELIRRGAASRDVHDAADSSSHFAKSDGGVDDAYLAREVGRTETHQRAMLPLLEPTVGVARRILDFGCGTGGTTVALALSTVLAAEEVVGIDANADALRAAEVRAAGHGVTPPRVRFQLVDPARPIPFPDDTFDLVVCVSVLEFISERETRDQLVDDMRRVVAPGGFLYVATPRIALRGYHSRLWLTDFRREDGMPWASPAWHLARWARGWKRIPLPLPARVRSLTARVPGSARLERLLRVTLPPLMPWQRLLIQRPA